MSLLDLDRIVTCPRCHGGLERTSTALRCTVCAAEWPQTSQQWIDLFPIDLIRDHDEWERRQREMEQWYDGLAADPEWAAAVFEGDFGAFAHLFAMYSGTVLDLGGGNGITRHYLPAGTDYVVLDPSTAWLHPTWDRLSHIFPCLKEPPPFVRGTGEYMPFGNDTFDIVFALFSLNHVSDPGRVFDEVKRVLRPGGRFFVVLEDMEPTWRDLRGSPFRTDRRMQLRTALAKAAAGLRLRPWPVQDDHITITESELRLWTHGSFQMQRRAWTREYLNFEFQKFALTGDASSVSGLGRQGFLQQGR